MSADLDVPLTADEEQRLAECETRIRSGLRTFVEVGKALAEIRDGRLYRQTHETFEAYCEMDWQLSRKRAYDLMGAAITVEALSPMGDTPAPTSERQARELSGLAPETAAEVMKTAATSGKVTAETIRAAREVIAPKPAPAAPTYVHPTTGEVLDEVPAGYTTENPARIAAEARRDYLTSAWPVFNMKLLGDLRRWADWLKLPEIGGSAGVVAALLDSPLPDAADDALRAAESLDRAVEWIDELRTALRAASAPKLRSVK